MTRSSEGTGSVSSLGQQPPPGRSAQLMRGWPGVVCPTRWAANVWTVPTISRAGQAPGVGVSSKGAVHLADRQRSTGPDGSQVEQLAHGGGNVASIDMRVLASTRPSRRTRIVTVGMIGSSKVELETMRRVHEEGPPPAGRSVARRDRSRTTTLPPASGRAQPRWPGASAGPTHRSTWRGSPVALPGRRRERVLPAVTDLADRAVPACGR